MQKGRIRWLTAGLLALFLPLFPACDEDTDTLDSSADDTLTLRFGWKVQTIGSKDGTYQTGTPYENYIDMAGGDYRICFFDEKDRFIATFRPDGWTVADEGDYTTYNVLGKVPGALLDHKNDFKVVMLANWESYGEGEDGEMAPATIDELCTAEWSQFRLPNFALSKENRIPFYGVHEYQGKDFKAGQATILEPIPLLRAVAKVEVVFQSEAATLAEVNICHYNEKGYSAPLGVYSPADDDPENTEKDDFVNRLHLVNGKNDEADRMLPFLQTKERIVDDTTGVVSQYETWVAYLPEYDNTGDDFAYIEVKLDYQAEKDEPFRIYFADYGKEANPDRSTYDIQRNHFYRFTVTLSDHVFKVNVNEWNDAYNNSFDFKEEASEGIALNEWKEEEK